jgi:succinyl-diaminopimelate desuccinylase
VEAESPAVALTRCLVAENSINPPGDEEACAHIVAGELEGSGFSVSQHDFGDRRVNLVAMLQGSDSALEPLVLTGHLDTVPLGSAPWSKDPFGGEVCGDRIYGRGVSDMKAGVAAMAIAAINSARRTRISRSLKLIFTGGEETGCEGALALLAAERLGLASAIIVGEPTGNKLALGHKGCLCMRAVANGVTAHSSMPELGSNAIYRAAEGVIAARNFDIDYAPASSLGQATLNVGTINGGINFNSVPDMASFTVDMRTTDQMVHDDLANRLEHAVGKDLAFERLVDMRALLTAENEPFVDVVKHALAAVLGPDAATPRAPMPFFTDGSVMQRAMRAPAVILGPGEPDCAHQTDEWCYTGKINEAVAVYERVIADWCV